MCGIAGLYALESSAAPPSQEVCERMVAALQHRGPDDGGIWSHASCVLGMRRLSVIDIDNGRQPMTNENETVALVYNGELYNFRELRDTLKGLGHQFRTQSDTEVMLRAYEAWGADMLPRLNGMFALAIYDARGDKLLLMRDRLGIKPLFYGQSSGQLQFASELPALERAGFAGAPLQPHALAAYLEYGYVPAPDCIMAGVHKLLPGHYLEAKNGQVSVRQWWRISYEHQLDWTLGSASERFLELLEDAVRIRLVSDVPLGAFLSGGLDSSAVVSTMARLTATPVKTFTMGFDDAAMDESPYAAAVARHVGSEHHHQLMRPDAVSIAERLPRFFGEPFADSSAVPVYLVSKLARQHVTAALSGDGGDELFAGYAWLHMDRHVRQYRHVPRMLRRMADSLLMLSPPRPTVEKLRRFSRDAFMEPYASFRRRHQTFTPDLVQRVLRAEVRQAAEAAAIDRWREHADAAGGISPDNWMLYQDAVMYLPDDILTKVDRMSMANSLEVRVPLLDHRMVEFAATVPFALKVRHGRGKRLMRHALRNTLPGPILRPRKQGFSIPVHRWFRTELRSVFHDHVLSPNARLRDYCEQAAIRPLAEAHEKGEENFGHHFWALLMLEHWLAQRGSS